MAFVVRRVDPFCVAPLGEKSVRRAWRTVPRGVPGASMSFQQVSDVADEDGVDYLTDHCK